MVFTCITAKDAEDVSFFPDIILLFVMQLEGNPPQNATVLRVFMDCY